MIIVSTLIHLKQEKKIIFMVMVTVHCRFLVPGNTQKILTEIWHLFWDKNDGENQPNYAIEIIFKSHEPFQGYQLTGPANSARKAG